MNWIIKPGFFERKRVGKSQPGLDLSRVIGDWLVRNGFATTTDCCTYTAVPSGAGVPTVVTGETDTTITVVGATSNSMVFLNGQLLTPTVDYTVDANTGIITFDVALEATDTVIVFS